MDRDQVRAAIRARALAEGFDAIGFTAPELGVSAKADLAGFLAQGYQGDMGWLAENADRRADPQVLWPEALSVVVLGVNYGPDEPAQAGSGGISLYARGRDYHDVLKKRLRVLARWIGETWPGALKLFVDTAPVMEKNLAAKAGLGWQGKHTNLVSTEFGSWLFLGEIFLTLDLAPRGEVGADRCGSCRRCLDACPTGAFPAPHRLDARRCISYLTIEHKGHIDRELRAPIGSHIYGCDDCLAVCPWNKFARQARLPELRQRQDLAAPSLEALAGLDDAGFRQFFSGSPIKRVGRDRFIRNVLIAIGNSGDGALIPAASRLLGDPSPLVRAMAVWALSRLCGKTGFDALKVLHASDETDAAVLEEWRFRGEGPAG